MSFVLIRVIRVIRGWILGLEGGDFEAKVLLDKRETFIGTDFTIKGNAKLVCDRTLEPFDHPMSIHRKVMFKYGDQPEEISDWSVETALDALIRAYAAEQTGRTLAPARLSDVERALFDRVRAMCEWRLGRNQLAIGEGQPLALTQATKTLDEILACLKRVRTSVKRWHKSGGRRGYLDCQAHHPFAESHLSGTRFGIQCREQLTRTADVFIL